MNFEIGNLLSPELRALMNEQAKELANNLDTTSPIAKEWLDYFKGFFKTYYRSGSRVICNPPPLDTDDDYILLCGDQSLRDILETCLLFEGFRPCTADGDYSNEDFGAYRKGDLNLIVTHDKDYFDGFVKATKLAKKLNLLKKEDRISLFKAVARNEYPEE